jgi:hypothetical protein
MSGVVRERATGSTNPSQKLLGEGSTTYISFPWNISDRGIPVDHYSCKVLFLALR